MKIPQKLPQFEKYPAIFVASGEYESIFYLVNKGEIAVMNRIKMAPREEAQEKQAFVGKKRGMLDPVAVSHHGNYIRELKLKFAQKNHAAIQDSLATYHPEEICLFAPKYVQNRIIKSLSKAEQKQVRMKFEGNHTKENPLELLKLFQAELDKNQDLLQTRINS